MMVVKMNFDDEEFERDFGTNGSVFANSTITTCALEYGVSSKLLLAFQQFLSYGSKHQFVKDHTGEAI